MEIWESEYISTETLARSKYVQCGRCRSVIVEANFKGHVEWHNELTKVIASVKLNMTYDENTI